MAHLLARLVAMNDRWAQPFGDFNHRWLTALFRPLGPVKDLLHGRWLGHPLHSATTDLPTGLLLAAVILDLAGQRSAADIALVLTIVTMLLAAVSGLADYSDTDGTARTRATTHATLMTIALVVLLVSLGLRAGDPSDRLLPVALSIIGLLIVAAGAFVGGDVVYVLGNMVSRHAFRGAGTKWIKLDTGDVADLATLPEAAPTKMRAGINDLVVVRIGDTVHAMHAVCAHAGRAARQGHGGGRVPGVPVARVAVPPRRRARRPRAVRLRPAVVRAAGRRGRRVRGPSRGVLTGAASSRGADHRAARPVARPADRRGRRREVDARGAAVRPRRDPLLGRLPGDRLGRRRRPARDAGGVRAPPPRARERDCSPAA